MGWGVIEGSPAARCIRIEKSVMLFSICDDMPTAFESVNEAAVYAVPIHSSSEHPSEGPFSVEPESRND